MDNHVKNVLEECTRGSDEARLTFPQVVGKLMEVGVERYYADFQRSQKTYYMPNGESHVVASSPISGEPAKEFSSSGIQAAVRAIQAQRITYKQFCEDIAGAGCVGYFVSLLGRRAVYFGRSAERYEEPFPNAK